MAEAETMADSVTEDQIRQALVSLRAKLEDDLTGVTCQQVRRDLEKHFNLPELALESRKGQINSLFNDVVLGMPDLDGGRIARRRTMPACTASTPLGRVSPTVARTQSLLSSHAHTHHPRHKPKPFHSQPPGPPQHHVVEAIRQTGCTDSAKCMLDLDDLQKLPGLEESLKTSIPGSDASTPKESDKHAHGMAAHGMHDEEGRRVGCMPRIFGWFSSAH